MARSLVVPPIHLARLFKASDATASKMMSPWIAFSHWGLPNHSRAGGQVGAEEDKGRSDRAQQGDADQAARQSATASRDGNAAHNYGGDDLELQAGSGVGVDVGKADRVEQGGQSGQYPP